MVPATFAGLKLVPVRRIELLSEGYKSTVIPLYYTGKNGREDRDRTCDLAVPNRALYHLSYFPLCLLYMRSLRISAKKFGCPSRDRT